jgi:hypothetical protein
MIVAVPSIVQKFCKGFTSKHSFKVLVCSDPTIDGALVIEWFEIRLQVEVLRRHNPPRAVPTAAARTRRGDAPTQMPRPLGR